MRERQRGSIDIRGISNEKRLYDGTAGMGWKKLSVFVQFKEERENAKELSLDFRRTGKNFEAFNTATQL